MAVAASSSIAHARGEFDRGRRGQAGVRRESRGDDAAQAGQRQAGLLERPGGPDDVVEPRGGLGAGGVEVEAVPFAEVETAELDSAIVGRHVGDPDLEVDGRRHHEAVVVVGVLADQVHAPRGSNDADVVAAARRLGLGGDERLDQGVAVDVVAHLIVSGAAGPASSRAASSARLGRPVWSPSVAAAAAPHALPAFRAAARSVTLEPGGDEAGTERVAGTDRVHDHRQWHGRGGDGSLRVVACDREAAAGTELGDDDRGAEREGGASEVRGAIGRAGIPGAPGHLGPALLEHGQLVRASQHQVGERGKAPQDGSRLVVRPEPPAQVEVEADGGLVRAREPHRGLGRLARLGREGRGDPGHVEPANPVEDRRVGRAPDVRAVHARAGRPAPRVHDLGGTEDPPLAEHERGGRIGIGAEVGRIDAFAAQPPGDGVPEPVGPDAPDVGHLVSEAGEPDGHVRLGARDEPAERRGLGQRPRFLGDERDQALAERDDFRHGRPVRAGARLARASATAAVTCAARVRIPPGSPSPSSQPPIPTATAPAEMKAGAVSSVTPPVGSSGMSGNGPRSSRTNEGPAEEAGKSLTAAAPARHAARISVGVAAPGKAGMPRAAAHATSSASRCGITRNVAPASIARCAASIDRTVPAPSSMPASAAPPATASIDRRASASGSFNVSSKARTPPSASAVRMCAPRSAAIRRPMATTPPLVIPAGISGRVSDDAMCSPPVAAHGR